MGIEPTIPIPLPITPSGLFMGLSNSRGQEPITRSEQLNYFRATAFSQVRLFLDTPFPPKISVSGYLRIEIWVNKKWRPNAIVLLWYSVFH